MDFDEFYDYDLYAGMCVSFRPDQNYWPNNETSVQRPLCSDRTVLVIIDKDSLWDLCSDDECCRYMHTDLICCPPENKELFVGKASDRANCDNGIKYFWTCEGAVYPEEL